MIKIKFITVKNFMSFGNTPTTLYLDQHQSTLVQGLNGTGKSSLVTDGLSFGLFGKAYRNLNKGQLVNSINQKDCNVKVGFSIGTDEYLVSRSMRPERLEIFKNDKLIDQEAAVRDYQGYLEKNILNLNYKTFSQLLILGSAVFAPFMQLSRGVRREVIDDVLDIAVFTKMNQLLKEHINTTKDELALIGIRIESAKKETVNQQKVIELLQSSKEDNVNRIKADISELESKKSSITEKISWKEAHIEDLNAVKTEIDNELLDTTKEALSALQRAGRDMAAKKSRIHELDKCPTCLQDVCQEHKTSIDEKLTEEIQSSLPKIQEMALFVKDQEAILDIQSEQISKINECLVDIKFMKSEISLYDRQIDVLRLKMEQSISERGDVQAEREKLKEIAATALALIERKSELIKEKSLQEVALGLLKETGIKAYIVKEYLPLLNQLINKYLTEFDFFVNFELDENFNEVIKSRGRDDFSYYSFSEGEKKRIDISILMAFRHIASIKNSAKINLLVTDECDGGLDPDSLAKFVEIVTTYVDTNSWVISHVISGTDLVDEFHAIATVKKRGDFSEISVT